MFFFVFPVKGTLEIFGMEIDNKLTFSKQLSNVRKKWINNQFKTLKNTNRNIYFTPCILLLHCLHFCAARDADKLEALNKRILSVVVLVL